MSLLASVGRSWAALNDRIMRWYGVRPERLRREVAHRATMLPRLLIGATVVWIGYVAFSIGGAVHGKLAPIVPVTLGLGIVASTWLLRRGKVHAAATSLLVPCSHLAASLIESMGMDSAAPSLLSLTIVVCGLLVGGYFLATWTAICCALVVMLALVQAPPGPAGMVIFWCLTFCATGWLVWLFARSSERLLQVSLGQTAALTRLLHEPLPEGPPDAFIERALAAVSEQFGGARVSLLAPDASRAKAPATALVVPLAAGDGSLGSVVIEPAAPRRFTADEIELAQALARQIAITLRFAELAASDRRSALREDRTRIARDIHDSLAQGFTGIVLQLNAAEEVLGRDVERARTHIDRARSLARTSLAEARRSIWALRPPSLDRESLPAAMERTARELVAGTDVDVRVEMTGAVAPLPAIVEGELLRVGQELIVNAIRHGRARSVRVATQYEQGRLTLRIDDDGSGPPPESSRPPGVGFGSTGLRERVSGIGGSLTVEASPGRGTCTSIVVPIDDRAPGVAAVREVG